MTTKRKPHEWEQIDQGEGYCLNCGATSLTGECAEQKPREPKAPERVNIPHDAELESIKRTLYNAIDKLDRIQRRNAELITT